MATRRRSRKTAPQPDWDGSKSNLVRELKPFLINDETRLRKPDRIALRLISRHASDPTAEPAHDDKCRACALAWAVLAIESYLSEVAARTPWISLVRRSRETRASIRALLDDMVPYLEERREAHAHMTQSKQLQLDQVRGDNLTTTFMNLSDHVGLLERPWRAAWLSQLLTNDLELFEQSITSNVHIQELVEGLDKNNPPKVFLKRLTLTLSHAGFDPPKIATMIDDGQGGTKEQRRRRVYSRLHK